jgi:2-polyprenyl-3-methyl-5-hydroxy-6-metoxy-1,4-benzoquinol methylase
MPLHYPEFFEVRTIEQAREVILTTLDTSTEERWAKETPYLIELIGSELKLTRQSTVLDYGCGVGRIAKGLIETFGCRVIGMDPSFSMRELARGYVQSDLFAVTDRDMLDWQGRGGLRVDGVICVWVLQHCLNPQDDIVRMSRMMSPHGRAFVLNNLRRAVPTRDVEWWDDGIDIRSMLLKSFNLLREGAPDAAHTSDLVATETFWATYSVMAGR